MTSYEFHSIAGVVGSGSHGSLGREIGGPNPGSTFYGARSLGWTAGNLKKREKQVGENGVDGIWREVVASYAASSAQP